MGFVGTQTYKEDLFSFEPGDTLFVFSDGVTEAMNENHDQFEEDNLEQILRDIGDVPADEYIKVVHEAVKKHAGTAPQNDDITILVVKREK